MNNSTLEEVMDQILKSDYSACAIFCSVPNLPVEFLREVAKKMVCNDMRFTSCFVKYKGLTEDIMLLLAEKSPQSRIILVSRTDLPKTVAEFLADNGDNQIKVHLLERTQYLDVQKKLIEDKEIASFLSKNQNTTSELLEQAFMVSSDIQREKFGNFFADHKKATPRILTWLSKSLDPRIREAVAENPNTPPEVLALLAYDKSSRVKFYVAKNPQTPASALSKLATSLDPQLRKAVANNPNVPNTILLLLLNDPVLYVREEAKRKLKP